MGSSPQPPEPAAAKRRRQTWLMDWTPACSSRTGPRSRRLRRTPGARQTPIAPGLASTPIAGWSWSRMRSSRPRTTAPSCRSRSEERKTRKDDHHDGWDLRPSVPGRTQRVECRSRPGLFGSRPRVAEDVSAVSRHPVEGALASQGPTSPVDWCEMRLKRRWGARTSTRRAPHQSRKSTARRKPPPAPGGGFFICGLLAFPRQSPAKHGAARLNCGGATPRL